MFDFAHPRLKPKKKMKNTFANRGYYPEKRHPRNFVMRSNGRIMTLNENQKELPEPPWPTHWPPGSPKKISVMKWRAKNGYHIHHPLDQSMDRNLTVIEFLTKRFYSK